MGVKALQNKKLSLLAIRGIPAAQASGCLPKAEAACSDVLGSWEACVIGERDDSPILGWAALLSTLSTPAGPGRENRAWLDRAPPWLRRNARASLRPTRRWGSGPPSVLAPLPDEPNWSLRSAPVKDAKSLPALALRETPQCADPPRHHGRVAGREAPFAQFESGIAPLSTDAHECRAAILRDVGRVTYKPYTILQYSNSSPRLNAQRRRASRQDNPSTARRNLRRHYLERTRLTAL